jgi:branched-chain amino acid transport system ATP-binding protein
VTRAASDFGGSDRGPASLSADSAAAVASTPRGLAVTGVSKSFEGVHALEDVSIQCTPGEIVGLIGPNGAGKTTLVNVISGIVQPDEGVIALNGKRLIKGAPRHAARAGIGRTFQNVRLFARLTVQQNIEVSAAVRGRHRDDSDGLDVGDLLVMFELEELADRKAATLPYGTQRQVEFARAVALAPEFLLVDEPAAGMNAPESARLSATIRRVVEKMQCGILLIDHDLRFILGMCEQIYVLHEGRIVFYGDPDGVQADETVREVYLGTKRPRNRTNQTEQESRS